MASGTTVWIDDDTRDALRRLQEALGTPSVNATIRRLLEQPATDARAIFASHRKPIRDVMRRHRIRKLVAFGSRARGNAGPASDLDLAAELDPKADPLALLAAEADLEAALGMKVDLVELSSERLRAVLKREGVAFEG